MKSNRLLHKFLPVLCLLALPGAVHAQRGLPPTPPPSFIPPPPPEQIQDYICRISEGTVIITDYTGAGGDVTIPASLKGLPVIAIGNDAFCSSTDLTSVTIPDSVTSIGQEAFGYCSRLTAITVDAANPAYSSRDGVLFKKNQAMLLQYPGGKAGAYAIPDSVIIIGEAAFRSCSNLTSVTIPDSVRVIEGYTFADCSNLTAITVDAANLVYSSMDGVLFEKNQAALLQFPDGKAGAYTVPDSVTSIGYEAFSGCTSLTGVIIPDSVTSIGYDAFSGCTSLTSVTIPDSVTSIGWQAFSGCTSLTNITIPDSVTSIEGAAFAGCSNLTGVIIPDSVTSIGYAAFIGCTSLTSVTIPDSVTSIGYDAFSGCTSLTNVTIGNSVTRIGGLAFAGCSNLTSVTIPASVTFISTYAFAGCTSLTTVTFEGNAPDLSWGVFMDADKATVYYLAGTTGWDATYAGRPTVMISGPPDLLIGGMSLNGYEGWFLSEWFGVYYTDLAPWLFHSEHGFVYRDPSSSDENSFFYDDAMGAWWWTSENVYPFIYVFNPPMDNGGTDIGNAWLFYFEGSIGPRTFGVVTGPSEGQALFFDSWQDVASQQ